MEHVRWKSLAGWLLLIAFVICFIIIKYGLFADDSFANITAFENAPASMNASAAAFVDASASAFVNASAASFVNASAAAFVNASALETVTAVRNSSAFKNIITFKDGLVSENETKTSNRSRFIDVEEWDDMSFTISDPTAEITFCDNEFNVVYLCQGKGIFDVPDWYKLFYQEDDSFLIFFYYDHKLLEKDESKLNILLNEINKNEMKLLIISSSLNKSISFAVGRNILLLSLFKYEAIMLKNKCNKYFNYASFIDADLELYKWNINKQENNEIELHNLSQYKPVLNDFYYNFLFKYQPFIGLPHRIDRAGFMIFPEYPNKNYVGFKYLYQELFDPMIAYYIRPLLNNRLLFPLYTKFDYRCWWWSGHIQRVKIKMLFPFKKNYSAAIAYLPIGIKNPGHTKYPTNCGNGPDHFVITFNDYINKYYHNKDKTECSSYNNTAQFIKWERMGRTLYLNSISRQNYPFLKNDPDHYLDEFVCDDY